MNTQTIGFIGGGNMARCLIGGLLQKGYAPAQIWVSNPHEDENLAYFRELGVQTTVDNTAVVNHSHLLIFAVKPQVLPAVSRELAPVIQTKQPCVVSIAAGIRIASLQQWVGQHIAIVRAMPNTPALVGYSATGLYANQCVSTEQKKLITWLMESVGIAVWLTEETQIDTVTALSGSGPAYFFLVMESLMQASIDSGLPVAIAEQLTIQTAMGAAHLASASNDVSLAELRARVTSPGGTTERAVNVLENNGVRALFAQAVAAAELRAVELADTASI